VKFYKKRKICLKLYSWLARFVDFRFLDGWKDRRMDGWMDGLIDERMDVWIDGWIDPLLLQHRRSYIQITQLH